MRRERLDAAAEAFGGALGGKSAGHWATIGGALVHLRTGDPGQAINLLGALPNARVDARTETYLAQAHLAAGNLAKAIEVATVAIDESDSVHGLSWLVRAEARIAWGQTDHAIADLNRALAADDEAGIEARVLELLEKLDGGILEEDELENLERSLDSR